MRSMVAGEAARPGSLIIPASGARPPDTSGFVGATSRRQQPTSLPCRPNLRDKMPPLKPSDCGEVREWTNRHAWKACVPATGPWVRIPPSAIETCRVRLEQCACWNCHREPRRWDSNEGDAGRYSRWRYEGAGPQWGARRRDWECPNLRHVEGVTRQAWPVTM